MIGSIRNKWLRRAAIVITTLACAPVVGVLGALVEIEELYRNARKVWND